MIHGIFCEGRVMSEMKKVGYKKYCVERKPMAHLGVLGQSLQLRKYNIRVGIQRAGKFLIHTEMFVDSLACPKDVGRSICNLGSEVCSHFKNNDYSVLKECACWFVGCICHGDHVGHRFY